MLSDVIDLLACPLCAAQLGERPGTLVCERGHVFDVARHGYASLLAGDAHLGSADTTAMVAARERFLSAGHFEGVAEALVGAVDAATKGIDGAIADVGAGTGYYLAHVLGRLPERRGIALDLSKYAARRAARGSGRLGAVVCDVWRGLPIRSGALAAVTNVFAPRNAPEMARVLAPGGALVVVTPTAGHLAEIVGPLGLLSVDEAKADRVASTLSPYFERVAQSASDALLGLSAGEVADLVLMGPTAHHVSEGALRERIAQLEQPVAVSVSALVSTYRVR